MKRALDEQLCQKYPSLYRDRQGEITKTLMCWGFECADGWYYLIDSVSDLLTTHEPEAVAIQVKEKFGGLRFYYRGGGEFSCGMTSMAEYVSDGICEICGAPGAIYNAGWVATRCEKHVEKRNLGGTRFQLEVAHVHGLGLGWSRLIANINALVAWDTEKNRMPPSTLSIAKTAGRLQVSVAGGDDRTAGMVAFINHYANRIDEETGVPNE